ncbi:NAD(P)/FAD-dependent oxidoreductase [Deinococcus detaillensis]|uniref:NAD(P)/FAD-dependent oxidoreductase n=1 Tax=Deinococcus detaillensis TaxID=2592048 RepID=A0A553V4T9_9DEIO|nr:NAD(P)/FAD-dependent oxidoreductase [Deinococcus detaillensis]TSA87479.1 NAD(P)/FAD-dependent oxidoreductase [Deinococcus detaillensis]
MTALDAVVIGAGAAGLAAAYGVQRRGLRFVVLEAGQAATGAWPAYYDSLKLFTPARHSALPGLPFSGSPQRYPGRDEMSAYLQAYAAYFAFPVEFGADVAKVQKRGRLFSVTARDCREWTARAVVCASGTFQRPYQPDLPNMQQYRGRLLHSAKYTAPQPFAGQRVIVVGAGNSAAQIAAELGRVARVTLAVRRPPRLFPQRPFGVDLIDWLALSGIERLPLGAFGRVPDAQPVIAVPHLRSALQRGNPDLQPMFKDFTSSGVRWQNGQVEPVNTVIFATGYAWNGAYLPPEAVDPLGEPRQRLGVSSVLAGLYFTGLPGQRSIASGTIRAAGPDAEYVAAHLSQYLEEDCATYSATT